VETKRGFGVSLIYMKTISFPVLLVAALVAIGGGGLIYALTAHFNAEPPKPVVIDVPPPPTPAPAPVPVTEVTTPSPDTAPAPEASTNVSADAPPQPPVTNPQGNPGQNGRGQHMQQMFAQLGLSADQQQQIQQIRSSITDRQQRHDAIMKVLTPDQQSKLQALRAQWGNRQGGGGGNGGAGGGGGGGEAAPATPAPAAGGGNASGNGQ
jgi:Spy/CpxP family protein refolding chaperone